MEKKTVKTSFAGVFTVCKRLCDKASGDCVAFRCVSFGNEVIFTCWAINCYRALHVALWPTMWLGGEKECKRKKFCGVYVKICPPLSVMSSIITVSLTCLTVTCSWCEICTRVWHFVFMHLNRFCQYKRWAKIYINVKFDKLSGLHPEGPEPHVILRSLHCGSLVKKTFLN